MENNSVRWYVIHTLSGSENRVKREILDQIAKKKDMSDYFHDIVIPVIEVPEIRRGKNVNIEKKFMPGYILLKMVMNKDSWHLVKNVKGVTHFLGGKISPQVLTEGEVQEIFNSLELKTKSVRAAKTFDVGDTVLVTEGPFEGFNGKVEEVDIQKSRLRVSISIFGKATPIDITFEQVKRGESFEGK